MLPLLEQRVPFNSSAQVDVGVSPTVNSRDPSKNVDPETIIGMVITMLIFISAMLALSCIWSKKWHRARVHLRGGECKSAHCDCRCRALRRVSAPSKAEMIQVNYGRRSSSVHTLTLHTITNKAADIDAPVYGSSLPYMDSLILREELCSRPDSSLSGCTVVAEDADTADRHELQPLPNVYIVDHFNGRSR